MTVLVSQVKQMISEGARLKLLSALHRRYSRTWSLLCCCRYSVHRATSERQNICCAAYSADINGALVLSLDTDFDGCMSIVKRLRKMRPCTRKFDELFTDRGQKTVGIEIIQQFEWDTLTSSLSPAATSERLALGTVFS